LAFLRYDRARGNVVPLRVSALCCISCHGSIVPNVVWEGQDHALPHQESDPAASDAGRPDTRLDHGSLRCDDCRNRKGNSRMTGRDIARMAFALEEPPRLPVTLFGGGSWMVHSAGTTYAEIRKNPEMLTEVVVRGFERIGHDLLWLSWGSNYPIHFLGCPIKDDSADATVLLGTVISSLGQVGSLSVDKVISNPTLREMIRAQHSIADRIGSKTLILSTQYGPLTCASKILGMEATMSAMVDDPAGLLKLLGFTTELIWAVAEPALRHPDILGIGLGEPLASGDLISADGFAAFAAPFLTELVQRARGMGKYCMIHICGNAAKALPKIAEIRPDCFSLDQKVDLRQAKEVLGGKVCVAGNVSPTGSFLRGRPEDVLAEARSCVRAWGKGGGFILTLGCDYPRTVPFENIQALMSLRNARTESGSIPGTAASDSQPV
jgi:uroporphyrinogen decarboxylase